MATQVELRIAVDEEGKITRVIDIDDERRIRLTQKDSIEGNNFFLEIGSPSPSNLFWLQLVRFSCLLRPDEIEPIIQLFQGTRPRNASNA